MTTMTFDDLMSAVAERATESGWWDQATNALEHLALSGVTFDAVSLTELGLPDPPDPHVLGAVFRWGKTTGRIEAVGYAQSRRPESRGSCVRTWRGVR